METCDICGASGEQIRLFDAIYDLRMASLCERCSIVENIPIIKKPNANQLKESETIKVSETMKHLSGIREPEKPDTFFQEDKLQELDKNPELEIPEKDSLNLINHFHWEIMKNRRRKGLSQKQLAESLGESEIAIQMLEKAKLPENVEILIKKLEQFFQTKLRNIQETEPIEEEPVLLDGQGQEIEIIPEEEMIFIDDPIEEKEESKEIIEEEPTSQIELEGNLDLKKINQEKVTIRDLQKLHAKKIEATKQEQIEEQKKIEERQRILEALRERDKMKIEERKKQEFLEKQKAEQERNKLIEEKKQELQEIKKTRI